MGGNTYELTPERVAKWKAQILRHAVPEEVLSVLGPERIRMPKNNSKTAIMRRYLPFGGVDNRWIEGKKTDAVGEYIQKHLTREGVTPPADMLQPVDITVKIQQHSVLYGFTDQLVDLHEDGGEIPGEISRHIGERMGLLHEMIDYAALKACGNKFYAGGGSSTAAVSEKMTLPLLRKVARGLEANHAKRITERIRPTALYDTAAVSPSFVVAVHTDVVADIRDLPGFVDAIKYAKDDLVHPREIGKVDDFRFVSSPELVPMLDAGVATASAPDLVANSTNVDVYPCIVCGREAWGKLMLRGMESFDPILVPVDRADKSDPLKQRGYYGAKMYAASTVLNDGWMAVVEVGVSKL